MLRPLAMHLSLLTIFLTGCASTTVVKNPGYDDEGIRFYRPKQYLLIEPAATAGHVKISTKVLPDYNEEYSIHINAGLGTNNTTVELTDGWNLGKLTVNVDSKATELIGAVTNAAKTAAALADSNGEMTVPARNVPMGFYEAVVGQDNCGRRQLFGWRYVGFMPFAPCPTEGSGGPMCLDCNAGLWGLVWQDGVMVFSPLGDLATQQAKGDDIRGPAPAEAPKGASGTPAEPMPVPDAGKV